MAKYRSAEGRDHPSTYDADTLHRLLVEDAVKMRATDLAWAVAAYERIAERRRTSVDAAFGAVVDEVEAITGRRHMPIHSGVVA